MFEITLSDAASEANCGSKLVSAIEKITRSVLPGSAAGVGAAAAIASTPAANKTAAVRRPLLVPRIAPSPVPSKPARMLAGVA